MRQKKHKPEHEGFQKKEGGKQDKTKNNLKFSPRQGRHFFFFFRGKKVNSILSKQVRYIVTT